MKNFWSVVDLFVVWCGGALAGCLTGYVSMNLSTMTGALWFWYALGMTISLGVTALTGWDHMQEVKKIKT